VTIVTPQAIIDHGRMSARQWVVVAITVCLNALDGFDVLSISFASPSIAKEWSIGPAILGWVLSMELVGMAFGSFILGGFADKIGRRPVILACLFLMATGMYCAGHAANVRELLAWRLLTGLGIGGMLAAINAVAAEFSSLRWRSLAMGLMVIGYPLGGVIGGLIVRGLLTNGTWRDIFELGAFATAAMIPVVWLLVPETVAFLERKRSADALAAINKTLSGFGHASIGALPRVDKGEARRSIMDIFRPGLVAATLTITLAYFAHITSFYFIIKWVPKIVVDMGFEPSAAAGVLMWTNVGCVTGGALLGLIALRTGLKPVTLAALCGSTLMIIWFGSGADSLTRLSMMVFVVGLFTNGAIAGLYAMFARIFPAHVRATGTGFAIGVGRGGAALAPVIAGYLFQSGYALQIVASIMAIGSIVGAVALAMLKIPETP
jgi:benzoate transport